MTLKASSNNFHPTRQLFIYSVKRTLGLTVLISVFMLIMCPGYLTMSINRSLEFSDLNTFDLDRISPDIAIVLSVSTALAALVYLFINFAFLYGRSSGDFFHALPLSRKGLFTARFAASVLPIMIPTALTYISMLVLLSFKSITGSVKYIILGFVFNVLLILMSCAFSTLFIICSGSIFDLILSFFTYNIGIVIIQVIANELCSEILIGYTSNVDKFLYYSTPFYYGFAKFFRIAEGDFGNTAYMITYTVKMLLIIIISLAVSMILYNRRKSEKSGVSYAYRFIYIICSLIVGVIGSYLLGAIFSGNSLDLIFWIFAVIGGILSVITYCAVNERGFKRVKRSVIIGACSALSLGVLSVILLTGGFGYNTRIPKKSNIESANVEICSTTVNFEDPELVIKLHKEIVDSISESDDQKYLFKNRSYLLSVNYSLKNGKSLERHYYIDDGKYDETLLKIYRSEENIKGMKEKLSEIRGGYRITYWCDTKEEHFTDAYLTKAELNKLAEIYFKELPQATEKSIFRTAEHSIEVSGANAKGNYVFIAFNLEDSFVNTLKYVESLNLADRISETDDKFIDEIVYD